VLWVIQQTIVDIPDHRIFSPTIQGVKGAEFDTVTMA